MKTPWTYEERCTLKKFYGKVTIEELLIILPNRSKKSIYSQVYYLRKRKWSIGN